MHFDSFHSFHIHFPFPTILVKVSITVIKHHDQQQLEKKGFISPYNSQSPPSLKKVREGTRSRNREAGTEQQPWKNAAYCLAQPTELSVLQAFSVQSSKATITPSTVPGHGRVSYSKETVTKTPTYPILCLKSNTHHIELGLLLYHWRLAFLEKSQPTRVHILKENRFSLY